MFKLPQYFYKYPTGTQQINSESTESYFVDQIGTDMNGDSFLYTIKDGIYPCKNFPEPETIFRANMVKSLFIESIRIISKWYFIPALILVNKQEILNAFNRIAFRITSEKILKDRHWSKFCKSFYLIIYLFLYRIGFEEKSCDKFSEIFCFIIDADGAYRFYLEDLFSASSIKQLTENPRKEVKRLIQLYKDRQPNEVISSKFNKVAQLLSIFLLIPKVKRSFIDSFTSCDYESLRSDEADIYWQGIRNDYNFGGLTFEERQKCARIKGYKYPQQTNMIKKITDEQIQYILNILQQDAGLKLGSYISIQNLLQGLQGELLKIPDKKE